jgi:hypothetical protein
MGGDIIDIGSCDVVSFIIVVFKPEVMLRYMLILAEHLIADTCK